MRKSIFKPSLGNIAIVLIAFAFVMSADARTVSLEEAMANAQRFLFSNSADSVLLSRGLSAPTFKLAYEAKTANKAATCFYVLNRPSSEGYIIMSADDRLPEVLGYSDNGEFNINNIPDNMKWWLSEYERQIEQVLAASNDGVMPIAETSFRDGWTKIEPLVTAHWDQGAPYNNLCPTLNGKKTLTGCVATAMAQVMNYHKWPITGKGKNSYTWYDQTLSMDFSEITFDWANMQDYYYDQEDSPESQNAVATLMAACGIGVNMIYNTSWSAATSESVESALFYYFDYHAKHSNRENMDLYDWENLIYSELQDKRPVLYFGQKTSGHTFVCDGYSNNGLFHINWGWEGWYDGYFLLSILDPYDDGNGYNKNQEIIYGIYPLNQKDAVEINGVYYCLIEQDGEAIVMNPDEGYYTGELIIPATVTYGNKTYKVAKVTDYIWNYCKNLTSLIVDAPINEITFGEWDNPEVGNIETIKLHNVTHIGNGAFNGCRKLKTLEFGDNLKTIGRCAFQYCNALTELTIPDKVVSIGEYAFNRCYNLTTLRLGNSLESIGGYAFQSCNNLMELIIPNKVASIGEYAFTYGSRLEKIVIPNSIKTIGDYAFYGGSSTIRTIISQIEEPFDLPANTFTSSPFTSDILYIPYGTIEKYQAKEVWKNFENTVEYLTVSVSADGLATYCPAVGVDFSKATDIAAYKVSVSGSTVNLTMVTTVAAGEGVLLRSLNGDAATEYLPVVETATKNEGNAFVGVLEDITLSETTGDYTNFVLSKVDGVVGFFKANNTTVAAGKAYLPVENYTAGARSLNIVFDDETTTGISEVENKQATAADDVIYTLSGARVKNPAKGIYIKNGQKIVIK